MNFPDSATIRIDPASYDNVKRQAYEWYCSLIGALVWVQSTFESETFYWRGQASSIWSITSSLHRKFKCSGFEELEEKESSILQNICQDFWFENEFGFKPSRDSTAENYFHTLALLQHHAIPTRLMT